MPIPNVLFRPQHTLTQRGRVGQAHELEPRSARTVSSGRRADRRNGMVTQGECAGRLKAGEGSCILATNGQLKVRKFGLDFCILLGYVALIRNIKDKRVQALRAGRHVKGFPGDIVARAQRRLAQLDAAADISDLRVPPSNHLEGLSGDRDGQYSIRINIHWRICFVWKDNDAYDVEIVDYH